MNDWSECVKISKKKNGPENVFLNIKGTKKIINVKVKSVGEKERERESERERLRV